MILDRNLEQTKNAGTRKDISKHTHTHKIYIYVYIYM